MSSKIITSEELNQLSADAMELMADVQDMRRRYEHLLTTAKECGLKLTIEENESETAFMRRIAVAATEREHDLAKQEALATIKEEQAVQFAVRRQPKSFFGRTFARLGRAIG